MAPQKRNPAPHRHAGRALGGFASQAETEPRDTKSLVDIQAPRRRDGNAEARIQGAIVEFVRTVSPDLICFHVPNGGLRGKAEAARLKWQGVMPGVPDLVIIGRDGRAWLLEVKAEGGSLSPEQRTIRDRCAALRIPFAVVRSIDDARLAFAAWKIETREAGQ